MIDKDKLERVPPPPPPPERPACESCGAMGREVRVPVTARPGEPDTRELCWLCAHAVIDHDAHWEHAHAVVMDCGCRGDRIYPSDYRAAFTSTEIAAPDLLQTGRVAYSELKHDPLRKARASLPVAVERARSASGVVRDTRRR